MCSYCDPPPAAERKVLDAQVRWRKVEERAVAAEAERDALREELENAEEFIETVTGWSGTDPDEADDLLAEIRAALAASVSKEETRDAERRMTYRTRRVLGVIRLAPGLCNAEIARRAEVGDPGQMSRLLSRLERQGYIVNSAPADRRRGAPNAWHIEEGSE